MEPSVIDANVLQEVEDSLHNEDPDPVVYVSEVERNEKQGSFVDVVDTVVLFEAKV